MLPLLITCPYGLGGTLNQELKYLWYTATESFDTGTFVQTDRHWLIQINLWSRIASKVFVQLLPSTRCTTFEELFQLMHQLPRSKRLPKTINITLSVVTKNSLLHAGKSIQSVAHKALLQHLIEHGLETSLPKDQPPFEIFLHLFDNQLTVYLNTSGHGLHERGYRTQAGDAPLKENVAAGLVLMSGRRRGQTLRDPCCGSGTICIEAALIARNIAPWLQRSFVFQHFLNYDKTQYTTLVEEARAKRFPDKQFQIYWSDNDQTILEKAKANAERAGVADTIQFHEHDLILPQKTSSSIKRDTENNIPHCCQCVPRTQWSDDTSSIPIVQRIGTHLHLITNPPYGKRLSPDNLKELYRALVRLSNDPHHQLTCITTYPDFSHLLTTRRPRKAVKNGNEDCFVWMKPRG